MERPITVEPVTLAGVPALHVHARALGGAAPTILHYHGWGSRKEGHLVTAEALAMEGFRVILPEAPRHGSRPPLIDPSSTSDLARHYWDIVFTAVHEAEALYGELIDRGWTIPDQAGVSGVSMGGMIAGALLARNKWARAATLCISCPCFEWLEESARTQFGEPPMSEAHRERLRQYDPDANVARIAPRPVLMLHGKSDKTLPVAGVRRFRARAAPLYTSHPDRLVLTEFQGLGHQVPVAMIQAVRDWFVEHM